MKGSFFTAAILTIFTNVLNQNISEAQYPWISPNRIKLEEQCALIKLSHIRDRPALEGETPCSLQQGQSPTFWINSSLNESVENEEDDLNFTRLVTKAFGRSNWKKCYFNITVQENCSLVLGKSTCKDFVKDPKLCPANSTDEFKPGPDQRFPRQVSGKWQQAYDYTVSNACNCYDPKLVNKLVGVIFSPYNKYPHNCTLTDYENTSCSPEVKQKHTSWFDYTKQEIAKQLETVANQFNEISTYGMGTVANGTKFNSNWRNGLPISHVPICVAELNQKEGFLKLRATIGIFMHKGYADNQAEFEMNNTISAVREANNIYSGSITGITVQYDALKTTKSNQIALVLKILRNVRTEFVNEGIGKVKVGLRIVECEKAFEYEQSRSEDMGRLYCPPKDKTCMSQHPLRLRSDLLELVNNSQFVICFFRPHSELFSSKNITMAEIVQNIGHKLKEIKTAVKNVNKNANIEVIGETGWPSEGRSANGSPNTLRNMRDYWVSISKWAQASNFKVFMFEAFDEPWKNREESSLGNKSDPEGHCGSEAHYGWWKRENNTDQVYVEKCKALGYHQSDNASSLLEVPVPSEECRLDDKIGDTDSQKEQLRENNKTVIFVGVGLAIFTVFTVTISYMGFRLRTVKKRTDVILSRKYLEMFHQGYFSPNTVGEKADDYEVIALKFPYDKRKYELPKGKFHIDMSKPIGVGQTGTVYLGTIEGYQEHIAFKMTDSSSSVINIKNLLSEIKIMSYTGKHEYVVSLLGAYTEKLEKGIVSVALEYCPLGSLDNFLKHKGKFKNKQKPIPPLPSNYVTTSFMQNPVFESDEGTTDYAFDYDTLVHWAYQIACGMEYLAGKKVVHADLAARNILLTSNKTVKITDFGLSRKLYSELGQIFDSDIPLPWRWMAPESLRHLTFSTPTDIWSYGVTLWEMFSLGSVPFAGYEPNSEFHSSVEEGLRLEEPDNATEEICDIMTKCWAFVPEDRPDFAQLKLELKSLLWDDENEGSESSKSNNYNYARL